MYRMCVCENRNSLDLRSTSTYENCSCDYIKHLFYYYFSCACGLGLCVCEGERVCRKCENKLIATRRTRHIRAHTRQIHVLPIGAHECRNEERGGRKREGDGRGVGEIEQRAGPCNPNTQRNAFMPTSACMLACREKK